MNGMIKAASLFAATAYAQYDLQVLTQNAKTWDAAIDLIPTASFEPTEGLAVRGEIGCTHTAQVILRILISTWPSSLSLLPPSIPPTQRWCSGDCQ